MRDIKISNDAEHQSLLKDAANNLYYTENRSGGLVEKRYNELTEGLHELDNV